MNIFVDTSQSIDGIQLDDHGIFNELLLASYSGNRVSIFGLKRRWNGSPDTLIRNQCFDLVICESDTSNSCETFHQC
jgi:hypothetical protein